MNRAAPANWIQNLLRPEAFPHPVESIQLLETHISWIVLTGQFAYKLKKPVHFPFVDFSTLERRRHACEDEIRLNQRWSSDLYLDVVRVTGSDAQPVIDGPDPVIEYAVKMRQFDQNDLLSHALQNGLLQPDHLERFAFELARFHQRADAAIDDQYGTPEAIRKPVMDNFATFAESELPNRDLDLLQRVRSFSEHWFATHHELLNERRAGGFIRECHGDLHLNNMLLVNSRIELFDCLEFNPALRWCDVMSEIAFLMMDLENRGRRDLARRFLNAYVEHTGDYDGLRVIPFYIAYRAMVRAKVDQLRRMQTEPSDGSRADLLRELEQYLEEAASYARSVHPRLAVISGPSGVGKSYHALTLVNEGFLRIRSDFERKRLLGSELHVPLSQPARQLPAEPLEHQVTPEMAYSHAATQRVYDQLVHRAEQCLRAGFSVVVDATCLNRQQRAQFSEIADLAGVPFQLFVLEDSTARLEQRIRQRQADGNDLSEADIAVLHAQLKHQEPLSESEQQRAIVINCHVDAPDARIQAWINSSHDS